MFRHFRIYHIKKLIFPLSCLLFIISLILFSETALKSASIGISLWFNTVLPSLLPFFIVSELLGNTGFFKSAGRFLEPLMRPLFNLPGCASFAFLMGMTGGYPVGAKITAQLRKDNLLSVDEAQRLLSFSNNSGPLFIIGTISTGIFKTPELGLYMLICHILAGITVGLLFRLSSKNNSKSTRIYDNNVTQKNTRYIHKKNSSYLVSAVTNSMISILSIGGFITLFSVIIGLFLDSGLIFGLADILCFFLAPFNFNRDLIVSLLGGIIEITSGINMISKITEIPLLHKLIAASFITGWAGFSVHSQVLGIIGDTDISMKPYLLGKILHGIISAVYISLGFEFIKPFLSDTKPVFFSFVYNNHVIQWFSYFLFSFLCLFSIILIIMLVIILQNIKSLHKHHKIHSSIKLF